MHSSTRKVRISVSALVLVPDHNKKIVKEVIMKPLKCVVVGDSGVGKTCLLTVYAQSHFPETYVPTIRDNFVMKVLSGNTVYELELFDTAGQEEYEKLRPLSYPGTVST